MNVYGIWDHLGGERYAQVVVGTVEERRKRLWCDEPRAHQKMAEAEPELIDESERWRDEERRKQEKKS